MGESQTGRLGHSVIKPGNAPDLAREPNLPHDNPIRRENQFPDIRDDGHRDSEIQCRFLEIHPPHHIQVQVHAGEVDPDPSHQDGCQKSQAVGTDPLAHPPGHGERGRSRQRLELDKDGTIAGPRVLEHLVDTVLYLEGERGQPLRVLRTAKNRFGPTQEVGIFEMEETGLSEVVNPSAFFLEGREAGRPGSVVICGMEGSRPILVELQALAASTSLPMPRRVSQGVSSNRLALLTAVLVRKVGIDLSGMDLYLNVVGGVDLEETALDLGIAMSIVSNVRDLVLPPDWVVVGEVGLAGEVRRVPGLYDRMAEAARLGFGHMIGPPLPSGKSRAHPKGLVYHPVTDVRTAMGFLEKVRGKKEAIP